MLNNVETKTAIFLKQYNLLPDGAKVLLAVSGGADSVALLQILIALKHAGRINSNFHIAHVNHQLRGEKSLEDEECVRTLAEQHNLPVAIEHIDVKKYAKENKLSIETAARFLRLGKLATIAQKNNCCCVATAHQKNDNAETIIHRLLRGTGFKGLAGIRPKAVINSTTFIRPLLCLSRKELEEYLVSQDIKWQIDHTNLDCRFTRNRIRYRLLPILQKQSTDNIIESLFVLAQHCFALSEKIESQTMAVWKECVIEQSEHCILIDTSKFNDYLSLLRVEVLQNALQQCGIGLQKFTNEHYDKIVKFLIKGRTGSTLQLPNKAIIKKQQKNFYLGYPQPAVEKPEPVTLKIPGSVHFNNWTIETEVLSADKFNIENIKKNKSKFVEWFDFEQIKSSLIARCRQKGDKFKPFGLDASKKIGKFLTSAKINPDQKKEVFLVCDNEKILWLAPIRRSNEAIVGIRSLKILKIQASRGLKSADVK